MQENIVQLAADYTDLLFKEQMSSELLYHDEAHTQSVREVALILAKYYKVTPLELEVLELATLFHDLGYIKVYIGHEAVSQEIAADFLRQHHYPASLIKQVQALIGATHIQQKPTNLLEKIIKDADLNNVGQRKYIRTITNLRMELDTFLNQQYQDITWYKANIKFLDNHSFFTEKAQELFGEKKKSNRKKVKKLIRKIRP